MTRLVDPLIGATVAGRYRVERLIGAGGMGTVYEIVHLRLGRRFALKKLASGLLEDVEALARFRREAEVVARFRHPHIVEVIDWETLDDGSPCIIMELLEGEDLAIRLRRGPLSWRAIAAIGDQVLEALEVAHAAGVIHRDLKPQNLFLARDQGGSERVKILDFGVSKVADARTGLTVGDQLIGTPRYMAPEQADVQAGRIGPATDVWAVGAILFEMATGREPFPAPSTLGTLFRIRHGAPESVLRFRPDAPDGFVELIERALSRDPVYRLASAEAMRRALAAVGRTAEADGILDAPVPGLSARELEALAVAATVAETPLDGPTVAASPTTLGAAAGESLNAKPAWRPRRVALYGSLTAVVAVAALALGLVVGGRRVERPAAPAPVGPIDASRLAAVPDAARARPLDAGSPSVVAPPDAAPAVRPTRPGRHLHPRGGGDDKPAGSRNPYEW